MKTNTQTINYTPHPPTPPLTKLIIEKSIHLNLSTPLPQAIFFSVRCQPTSPSFNSLPFLSLTRYNNVRGSNFCFFLHSAFALRISQYEIVKDMPKIFWFTSLCTYVWLFFADFHMSCGFSLPMSSISTYDNVDYSTSMKEEK